MCLVKSKETSMSRDAVVHPMVDPFVRWCCASCADRSFARWFAHGAQTVRSRGRRVSLVRWVFAQRLLDVLSLRRLRNVAQNGFEFLHISVFHVDTFVQPKGVNLARQSILATHCLAILHCLAKFCPFLTPNVSTRKVQKTRNSNTLCASCATLRKVVKPLSDAAGMTRISFVREAVACRPLVWRSREDCSTF